MSFRPLLEDPTGYATCEWRKGGKPPSDPVFMFKVLVLQKFHGLSDEVTEEEIFDRTSFKNFLALRIGDDIPDTKPSVTSSSASKIEDAKAVASPSKPSVHTFKAKAELSSKTWTKEVGLVVFDGVFEAHRGAEAEGAVETHGVIEGLDGIEDYQMSFK